MTMLNDEVAAARSRKRKATALVNPLVVEIAVSLMDLGGEAHRDLVINMIAYRRGRQLASPALAREMIEAFDLHRGQARQIPAPALFHLPFGDGSRRWALTKDARGLLKGHMPK